METRAKVEKQIASKKKEEKEEKLRMLAQRARDERAGIHSAAGTIYCFYFGYLTSMVLDIQDGGQSKIDRFQYKQILIFEIQSNETHHLQIFSDQLHSKKVFSSRVNSQKLNIQIGSSHYT